MKKIEEMLKNNNYDEEDISKLKAINSYADDLFRDILIVYRDSFATGDNVSFEAKEELEKNKKLYYGLRPVSTVLMLDPVIRQRYDDIQRVDTTSYYHGFDHIKNVIANMNKFITALGIDDKTADKLLTAVIFHDIGRTSVGKGHDINSANYFTNYVANDLSNSEFMRTSLEDNELNEIYNAILKHEAKEDLSRLSSFQLLVNLADKLDITKKRINLNGVVDANNPSAYYREIYLDVDDVSIGLNNNTLVINIIGNDNLSSDRLFSIPFMNNMENVLEAFCKSIGKDYQLLVNNELSRQFKNTQNKGKILVKTKPEPSKSNSGFISIFLLLITIFVLSILFSYFLIK